MGALQRLKWVLPMLGVFVLAVPAWAQQSGGSSGGQSGFGLRAGFGLQPDQFVVGGQFAIQQRAGVFKIQPSVDLGFGDDLTTIMFNADFLGRLQLEGSNFSFYGGPGLGVLYADPKGTDGKWYAGLNLVLGASLPILKRQVGSFEARFGIGDIPDFRLLAILEF